MLLGRYNILLMDEPSNFLDLPGIEALEVLMKSYAGTILFISHDQRLLENVADRIYAISVKILATDKTKLIKTGRSMGNNTLVKRSLLLWR
ncbi:hypothetical protein [Desulfitobacterium hafniense]|uniref:Uncharacterized protein n=1 Tax=Desulfitobacterium hafniense (strain Y51) TaxID=138119 RepID=Q252C3_DESHY|nr:hypothetical protein DSY0080 [Desulfitobacterium hafniense Y51]